MTDVWQKARLSEHDHGVWPEKWLSWMAAHGIPAGDAPCVTGLYRDPEQRQVGYYVGHWRPRISRVNIQLEAPPLPFPDATS